jgi:type IV pilus assembly protein PilY1
MMRRTFARMATLALVLTGALVGPAQGAPSTTMTDYTASPPFITKVVPPNILLLLDISGSLNSAAYAGVTFDPATTYTGLFEPTECYKRQSNRFVPDPAANPNSPGTCTDATYPWSGNLLNFGSMRRIDIVKEVMTGGICSTSRDTAGYCPTGGSNYIKAQETFDTAACCLVQLMSVTEANATNRVPANVLPGGGGLLYFHLVGDNTSLQGSFCLDNDTTPPTGSNCDDADAYNETPGSDAEYELWIEFTTPQGGVIQQVGDKARIGLMTFNLDEGAGVRNYIGATLSDTITNIDTAVPSTWTPLAESLYEATRYYAQIAPFYDAANYTVSLPNDPYYFLSPKWASTSAYVDCCKSYVILFTDGEPTQDLNIPAALQDFGHSVHGTHCTASPSSGPCTPHKTDYPNNGSHFLDDVAYYAHTTDLRQATLPVLSVAGKDLAGFQNLTIYTFYAFGQPIGREVLKATAKAGGFEDQNGNNLPDLTQEWDKLNNLTGAAEADGIPDTYYESANADDLKDRLVGAIYSILKRSASGTAASVLASSSTGEGAAYQAYFYPSAADVSGEVKWTGYLHSLWVDTFGNFREDTDGDGKQIYKNDKIVVTRYDATTGDVLVDRYADVSPEDGKADSTSCSPCGVALKELVPIWEAGKRLALKDAADRKIWTWVDTDKDGLVDTGEQIEFKAASPDNSATLSPYVVAEGTGAAPFTGVNIINFIRGEQITGLRNRELQVPSGSGTLKVWKLGDIVNSTPTIVGPPKERYDVIYGDSSYTAFFTQWKTRRMVAYVGANDGMLHAVNVGFYKRGDDSCTTSAVEHGYFLKLNIPDTTCPKNDTAGIPLGDELWGFIPYELLPHLQWLTREDYIHTYYVDLKPKVTDARIFCDAGGDTPTLCIDGQASTSHPKGWGTILIGGFRMGGSCKNCPNGHGKEMKFKPSGSGPDVTFYSAYFVLDITNPEADPKLLWSFTDKDLGFTTSYPTVMRLNAAGEANTAHAFATWFAVFGSGPTGYDARSSQEGKLFAVGMRTGPGSNNSLVTPFQSSQGSSFMGDLISVDTNLDFRADVVYAGNVTDKGSNPWEGKLYRLTTSNDGATDFGKQILPVNWGHSDKPTTLLDDFACSGSCTGANKPGPMAAAPTVTMDDSSNIWVFVGTGRFYDSADKTNTDTQYFFGVKDPVLKATCTQTSQTSCVQKDLVNVSSATVCVVGTGNCGQSGGTNQVTGVTGVTGDLNFSGTATTTLQGLVASKKGWYTTLPASRERALSSPTLFGGIVFFPTYTPTTTDVCSGETGNSSLYALFYLTGSAYKTPVIGTEASGGNTNVKRSTSLGAGVASQIGIHVGGEGTDSATGITSREKICTQMSTGQLVCKQGNPAQDTWSRYLSWINLRL